MRTFMEMNLVVTQDDAQLNRLLSMLGIGFDDNDPDKNKVYNANEYELTAGQTDLAIPFGAVTAASTVLIVAYSDVNVRLNGIGNTPIQIKTVPAADDGIVLSSLQKLDQPGFVFWHGKITSLHFTNPDGVNTARVFVALVGNAP